MKKLYTLILSLLLVFVCTNSVLASTDDGYIDIHVNGANSMIYPYDDFNEYCAFQYSDGTDYQVFLAINVESVESGKKYTLADMNNDWESFLFDYENYVYAYELQDADYTQTVDADGTIHIDAHVTADGYKYHLFGDMKPEHIVGDYCKDYDLTFTDTHEKFQVNVTQRTDDGVADVVLQAGDDNKNFMVLEFFCPLNFDSEYALPLGTYTINETKAVNTVLASRGVVDKNVTTSFASKIKMNNSLGDPSFMRSGTVTVAENAEGALITVDAKNSVDYAINATIQLHKSTSGIGTVEVKSVNISKVIENGKLVIVKGDKKYNAAGSQMK